MGGPQFFVRSRSVLEFCFGISNKFSRDLVALLLYVRAAGTYRGKKELK